MLSEHTHTTAVRQGLVYSLIVLECDVCQECLRIEGLLGTNNIKICHIFIQREMLSRNSRSKHTNGISALTVRNRFSLIATETIRTGIAHKIGIFKVHRIILNLMCESKSKGSLIIHKEHILVNH